MIKLGCDIERQLSMVARREAKWILDMTNSSGDNILKGWNPSNKDKFATKICDRPEPEPFFPCSLRVGEMKNPGNEVGKQPIIFFLLCYAFVQDHGFKGKEQPNIANNTEDHSATSAKDSENAKPESPFSTLVKMTTGKNPTTFTLPPELKCNTFFPGRCHFGNIGMRRKYLFQGYVLL